MDIVYVVGTGSRWKDNELRYSLRSIEKYLKGYGNVYIVGHLPDWVINVTHIHCDDIKGRKELSIMRKIHTACRDERITEDFCFFNDDHFLLKELNSRDIKYWYSSSVQEKSLYGAHHNIVKAINTLDVLGQNCSFFDIHVPIIFNKKLFRVAMGFPELNWDEKEYLVKSLYANYATNDYEYMKDCKISTHAGKAEIVSRIAGRLFFSVGPKGINADMKAVLSELYPDKSKYEW